MFVRSLLSLTILQTLSGHGALESPISRVYGCYLSNNAGAACRAAVELGGAQAVYDWNGVNILDVNGRHQQRIPDGQLCAAGRDQHKGFDLPRTDWTATRVAPGPREFVFRGTAPHATLYFRHYITRDGYDPTRPLTWSTLEAEPFCQPTWTLENGRFRMTCSLPNRTGRHLIYTIWQRSDSPEAFYSCSDVDFGGGAPPAPATWREIGQIRAAEALPAGTTVALRLFDAAGRDAGAPSVTLQSAQTSAADWPLALAREVNLRSSIVNIGVLGANGVVTPVASATANAIYARLEGYRAELDIRRPAPPPPGTGPAQFTYPTGLGSYQSGTLVQGAAGGLYRCRPAPFTPWCNASHPAGVLAYAPGTGHAWRDAWEFIAAAPVPPPPPPPTNVPTYPTGLASYTAGTVVRGVDGKLYRCRPFPNSGWCSSPSRLHYEPGVGTAWHDAWTLAP